MTYPWFSKREWNEETKTLIEKEEIAAQIDKLGFNRRGKFLAAIAGDSHMLAFDTGFFNDETGAFPIF